MKRRALTVALVGVAALALAACGGPSLEERRSTWETCYEGFGQDWLKTDDAKSLADDEDAFKARYLELAEDACGDYPS
jgi:hypothetical protein